MSLPTLASVKDRMLTCFILALSVSALVSIVTVRVDTKITTASFSLEAQLHMSVWSKECKNISGPDGDILHCYRTQDIVMLDMPLLGKTMDIAVCLVMVVIPKNLGLHILQTVVAGVNMLVLLVLCLMIYTTKLTAFYGLTGVITVEHDAQLVATTCVVVAQVLCCILHLTWWQRRRNAVYRLTHGMPRMRYNPTLINAFAPI